MKITTSHQTQRGVVLIISMMLLVVISLLGMESMTTSLFGSRLQINIQDNHRAFQSAQYAINSSQTWLAGLGLTKPEAQLTKSASNKLWIMDKSAAGLAWWTTKSASWWLSSTQRTSGFPEVTEQPRYFIEEDPSRYSMNLAVGLGYGTNDDSRILFRVTTNAPGAGTAKLQLQSVYAALAVY